MKKAPIAQTPKSYWLKLRSLITHGWRFMSKNIRPFFEPKYWVIYLCCFGIGFYLWGPFHGLEKIKFRPAEKSKDRQTKQVSIETLQRELDNLKQKLQAAQPKNPTPAFDPASFSRPASGPVILGFEWQYTDNCWRFHSGVDIALTPNSNVIAAAAGTITKVNPNPGGGYSVAIDHGGGWESVYANLTKVVVHPGQYVIKGVILGAGGADPIQETSASEGQERLPHLHFEVYHEKQPVDPRQLIDGLR
ncbi:MAG: M23 family metallopeptidase [Firmicutes bacterium]|nr:M23 family metallopeptidase [Bacillota bacterium]